MKRFSFLGFVFPAILVGFLLYSAAYTVESGNVAVERTLGKVNHTEQLQGLNFKATTCLCVTSTYLSFIVCRRTAFRSCS